MVTSLKHFADLPPYLIKSLEQANHGRRRLISISKFYHAFNREQH